MLTSVIFAFAFVFGACAPGSAPTDSSALTVIQCLPPQYTEAARRARIQGTVSISVVVGPEGTIIDQTVAHELPMGLPQMSLKVLPLWRFNPSTLAQRRATLEFVFQLDPYGTPGPRFGFEPPYRILYWAPGPLLNERPIASAAGSHQRRWSVAQPVVAADAPKAARR